MRAMDEHEVISKTEEFVRKTLENEGTGHDWWHIQRVRSSARYIAQEEGANLFIVDLGALLHDVADWKFHGGDLSVGVQKSRAWLEGLYVPEPIIQAVEHIVENISYKGAGVANKMQTLEGFAVQDADRLDAIGAIGIARAFAYGGSKGRALYDPDKQAEMHASFEAYKKGAASTIHHFHEKILLLKDRMNTATGKHLAAQRHAFMEAYLEQFHAEWSGSR